ncbi:MAG: ABC transporter permease [Deltaproteobacteria bacterium]|nr:MAG: ABC transporter permease [Deltaproteobacteria bacterium]
MNAVRELGRFGLFVGSWFRASVTRPPPIRASIEEAYRIGVLSLPILLIISVFVGTNLALQGYNAFAPLGGQRLIGMFVALAGVREMAPIMVASMVAAKAGTEMASQIAVMRIRDQIDALEVMAINPLWYLITPRFLGILAVLPALTMISIFTLTLSAYLVAVFQLGLDGGEFLDYFAQTTILTDFLYCGVKAFFFAIIICFVSCFYGFHCKPGPDGVGGATNSAVVVSAVVCAALNYLLSELLFGGRGL